MYLFAGTYSGMIAAMVGGLIVSITLFTMKRTMRREELKFVKTPKFPYRAWRWIAVQP
jgi:Na+(H+)/acetate symporter ActP